MKNPTKKLLKRKLKKLCSDLTYERDKKTCQWCKKKIQHRQGAHAHHIVSKATCNVYGRYDLMNLVLLCYRCHFYRLKDDVDAYINWRNTYLWEQDLDYPQLKSFFTPIVKPSVDLLQYLLTKLQDAQGTSR